MEGCYRCYCACDSCNPATIDSSAAGVAVWRCVCVKGYECVCVDDYVHVLMRSFPCACCMYACVYYMYVCVYYICVCVSDMYAQDNQHSRMQQVYVLVIRLPNLGNLCYV